ARRAGAAAGRGPGEGDSDEGLLGRQVRGDAGPVEAGGRGAAHVLSLIHLWQTQHARPARNVPTASLPGTDQLAPPAPSRAPPPRPGRRPPPHGARAPAAHRRVAVRGTKGPHSPVWRHRSAQLARFYGRGPERLSRAESRVWELLLLRLWLRGGGCARGAGES